MENLKDLIQESIVNEAREEIYSVAFIGLDDKEGIPLTVQVHVPREYSRAFEKYLEKEADISIAHADGLTNDYELYN